MLYRNAEFHNVAALRPDERGGVVPMRVPPETARQLELPLGPVKSENLNGVELRFVMESPTVTLHMAMCRPDPFPVNSFRVFHGGIQGGWPDEDMDRLLKPELTQFTLKKPEDSAYLTHAAGLMNDGWNPAATRVVFSDGSLRLLDIEGDIRPPKPEECPAKTLLAYGSSITYGAYALDINNCWVSQLARRLRMDCRNLGFAGCCGLEPCMADYLASEGEQGRWDTALLELGINVAEWPEEKIRERSQIMLEQVAGRNPEKPVFVISPLYSCYDYAGRPETARWRRVLRELTERMAYPNVTYIDGEDLLGNAALLSADALHPNLDGVRQIAERLFERIGNQ